jgi:hypothetical protein
MFFVDELVERHTGNHGFDYEISDFLVHVPLVPFRDCFVSIIVSMRFASKFQVFHRAATDKQNKLSNSKYFPINMVETIKKNLAKQRRCGKSITSKAT